MPERVRELEPPLEENQEIDPAGETPTPRASETPTLSESDPSQSKGKRQGENAKPPRPVQATAGSPPPTTDESIPLAPVGDDAPPPADAEEPVTDPLPSAGEAAAIGAMSAAEEAVRQRAEADYQRAIDNAIRAAEWRTDDALYVGLVDDIVRYRGRRDGAAGSFSSAAGAPGGDDRPWGASGRAPGAGAWGGDDSAAYRAVGGRNADFGIGPRIRPAMYGADDDLGRAEQVRLLHVRADLRRRYPAGLRFPAAPTGGASGRNSRNYGTICRISMIYRR